MSQTLIIIEKQSDWATFYPSDQVLTVEDYLNSAQIKTGSRVRVINLCKSYRYLSDGYYCSLLAEARGHHVIPPVRTLNDIERRALYRLQTSDLDQLISQAMKPYTQSDTVSFHSYFGTSTQATHGKLARKLFEAFPCPILTVTLKFKGHWQITSLKSGSPKELDDAEQTAFANALEAYTKKVWQKPKSRKSYRYDLAILHDPDEKLPPSNKSAINKFVSVGKQLGIDTDLITARDYMRLPEYDGLFIRETTAIDHHTYRFAKKAESEDMVVIDDPGSILRCTNKVYLADLFRTHKVPAPRTLILHKGNASHIENAQQTLGFPMVIKIPDGSFSRGIVKVNNDRELNDHLKELFQKSALILAQEFLYTEFDWRVGVLDHKPLYACRYFMVKNHWQIYRHGGSRVASGNFESLPVSAVPASVIKTALKATRPIGDGFYGVDIKEKDGKGYVIEVNDNPSIDHGVEDLYLGDELYRQIMTILFQRMEAKHSG